MEPALRQHQKGCLESVLSVVIVSQYMTANGPDHTAVPLHQCCKSVGVLAGDEAAQQFGVGQRHQRRRGPGAEMIEEIWSLSVVHGFNPQLGRGYLLP